MERIIKSFLVFVITILLFTGSAYAQNFVSGSTGVDGEFNPTTNTELQLPANGIFNFTTVNIPAGVAVTFKKNAANTPAYILATGDVNISGTISVSGSNAVASDPGKGAIGGFDGGYGGLQNKAGSRGMGPGGGTGGSSSSNTYGSGGGYGTTASTCYLVCIYGNAYGNERILPFIGGSGAGGGGGNQYIGGGGGGGGGGGAILIASSGTINITGSIISNGGNGTSTTNPGYAGTGGGGSGGAIKLIANTIAGNGTVSAAGGMSSPNNSSNGGNGRIRVEAFQITRTAGTSPAYTRGFPTSVFIANTPSIKITLIGGANVPQNPTGLHATPDITLPATTTNPVTVELSASNIPLNTTLNVTVIPLYGTHTDVASSPLSGTLETSTATASITLSTDYPSVIMAYATFTIQIAMFFDGERIEKVRVASTMGKGSEVTYITETGKEIPVEMLTASLVK